MGINSPFWFQTNETFTQSENATSYTFTIGQVTNWTQISGLTFDTPNPSIVFGPTTNINNNSAVNVTPQANGTYPLDFFGLGFTTYD
jgi:hypothetical protein